MPAGSGNLRTLGKVFEDAAAEFSGTAFNGVMGSGIVSSGEPHENISETVEREPS